MEPYVVLARRYRPRTFTEVLGQEAIARTLVHAIETGRVAHAYLFSGPRGIGKTSMARILAKALCCQKADGPVTEPCNECEICRGAAKGEDLDVIEIDGASNRGIDEVRTLRENARYSPARARFKIYIIDEVHMLTPEAFNALLKLLEEPPPHVKFIFATTEPQKVPATILSRCQRFDFRRIPTRTIVSHLKAICEQEGVRATEEVLFTVAQASTGGMRDAQSLLDQLITLGGGAVRAEDVASLLGTVSADTMEALLRAIGRGEDAAALALFEETYDQGIDPVEFLRQAMTLARDLLVLLTCGEETDLVDATPETRAALARIASEWGEPRILYGLSLFGETMKTVKAVGEGRALVSLAIVKLAKAGRLRALDEIVADLEEVRKRIGPGPAAGAAPAPGPERAAATAPAARAIEPPPEKEDRALFRDAALPAEGALRGEETVRVTLAAVKEAWPSILERVGAMSSAAGSFLAAGRVVKLTDHAVTVGFAPGASFQKKQLDDPDRIRVVEEAIRERFGAGLRLQCTVTEEAEEPSAPGPGASPGRAADGGPAPVTRAEVEKVNNEPIVSALKDVLSARLVNIERT